MSETVEASPAAVTGKAGLLPETNKEISSMADAFKAAMSEDPAPAEAPAEPAPEPEPTAEPEAEVKESRSAKDFKLIKQERDEAKAQIEQMQSKLTELEAAAGDTEKYDQLKAEFDEISSALSLSNLERHPKFREQFVKPIESQIERAQSYVAEEDRAQLAKVLKMPIGEARANALDELTGELPASRQAYLQSVVNRIDEISFDRDKQLEDSRASYDKLVEEEQLVSDKKSAERDKALGQSFDTMLKEAQDNIPIYQMREGDDEWNSGVRERVNLAKKILMEQNSFEDAATAALWAASGGALVEQNAGLVEHNRRLQAEISQLKGAEPEASGSAGGKPQPVKNSSFSDRVLGELRELGIRGAKYSYGHGAVGGGTYFCCLGILVSCTSGWLRPRVASCRFLSQTV